MMLLTTGGSSESHLPAAATSSRFASTPSLAHSWMPGPLTCAAVGGCPDTTRDLSTVIAVSPAPPATAKSFHLSPLLSRIFLSSPTDLASPPEVHQCSTSTSPAAAGTANAIPTASADSVAIAMRCFMSPPRDFGYFVGGRPDDFRLRVEPEPAIITCPL